MVSEFPHLERAPIREAVLDIKVDPREDITSEVLATFVEGVKNDFPERRPIQSFQAEFEVSSGAAGVRSIPPQLLGTICWNDAKTRAVQGRLDGFTVNHVQSYESWTVLRQQAWALWRQYVEIVKPTKVVRCALRYINRLELPVLVDMAANLQTRPEVAPELPQLVEDFFMRVVVPFSDSRKASITQASEPLLEPESTTRGLILDIDAFSTRSFDVGDDAIWQEFDELRTIKNRCFFKSVNETMWRAFQ